MSIVLEKKKGPGSRNLIPSLGLAGPISYQRQRRFEQTGCNGMHRMDGSAGGELGNGPWPVRARSHSATTFRGRAGYTAVIQRMFPANQLTRSYQDGGAMSTVWAKILEILRPLFSCQWYGGGFVHAVRVPPDPGSLKSAIMEPAAVLLR